MASQTVSAAGDTRAAAPADTRIVIAIKQRIDGIGGHRPSFGPSERYPSPGHSRIDYDDRGRTRSYRARARREAYAKKSATANRSAANASGATVPSQAMVVTSA